MAKAKNEGSDGGATKKQATGTKKAPTPSAEASRPKGGTKAAASANKSAASTTKSAASTEKQPAAGGAATKKRAPAKPATAGGAASSVPLIDTSLAAETAAKFVMNRALLGTSPATPTPAQSDAPTEAQGDAKADDKRESSAFKQLKAGLNKPAAQGIGEILGQPNAGKKGNTPFGGGNQQTGRNQTFGADVNRAGVPRRTGG